MLSGHCPATPASDALPTRLGILSGPWAFMVQRGRPLLGLYPNTQHVGSEERQQGRVHACSRLSVALTYGIGFSPIVPSPLTHFQASSQGAS